MEKYIVDGQEVTEEALVLTYYEGLYCKTESGRFLQCYVSW